MTTTLEVITLGTGVAIPQPDRDPTSTLVRHGDQTLLVDAGSGALRKLARCGVALTRLDAVVLTHAHLDHTADMLPLLFALSIPTCVRERPLDVHASPETLELLAGAAAAFGSWTQPGEQQVRFHPIRPGERREICGLNATTTTAHHTASSVAWRFDCPAGRSVGIPGDTGPHQPLHELLHRCDLLVIECALPDDHAPDRHLSPATLRALLAACRPTVTAVTHRYEELLSHDLVHELGNDTIVTVPRDMQTYALLSDPDGGTAVSWNDPVTGPQVARSLRLSPRTDVPPR